ncbi:hypothetical protein ACHAXT_011038 [Thalassiosira profunda]
MSTPPAFTLHASFSPLLSLYDAFLLDQFGVIHNGSEALHGAVDCIEELVKRKKKLAILSNTSSPSHVALKRLPKFGLHSDMFAGGLVSSGDECAKFVRKEYCNSEKPKKALWLTWKESEKQNPGEYLAHCESGADGTIEVAESVEDADFILLHGSEVWRRCRETAPNRIMDLGFLYNEDFALVDQLLDKSLERGLPLVCANPDLVVGLPGGVVGNMPGKIASRYEEKGGAVRQFGKPHPQHFLACLESMKHSVDRDDGESIPGVAHVGDSLEHDVTGANAAGVDSVFVLGGIHARELGLVPTVAERDGGDLGEGSSLSEADLRARLDSLFAERGIWPTHVVPRLSL